MNFNYTLTAAIARDLMKIEAARQTVTLTVLPPAVAEQLRQQARIRSTHYSTYIEGNRLTLAEAAQVLGERRPGPQIPPLPFIGGISAVYRRNNGGLIFNLLIC